MLSTSPTTARRSPIEVDNDTDIDLASLVTAIEAALDANDDFDVTLTSTTGDGEYNAAADTAPVLANVGATTAGVDQSGGISSTWCSSWPAPMARKC